MTRKEKAAMIIRELEKLYPETPVPLVHRDAYTLLIAVLLSAQCTDERVNKVTPELFRLADNPFDMVKRKVADIEAIVRPCGLSPAKSRHIHRLSELLIERHSGI
ncbi:MAG: endonuclease III domain-containing protein, partial [Bacteroidota bacterium]